MKDTANNFQERVVWLERMTSSVLCIESWKLVSVFCVHQSIVSRLFSKNITVMYNLLKYFIVDLDKQALTVKYCKITCIIYLIERTINSVQTFCNHKFHIIFKILLVLYLMKGQKRKRFYNRLLMLF